MRMLLSIFPEETMSKYNLKALVVDGWVYIEIRKGMDGLKQAGLLANQLLQTTPGTIWLLPSTAHTRSMAT
jgi:hypothetical protein